jgi:hypothetical protein
MFRYQIENIPGESNVWGDLLSRWDAKKKAAELKTVNRLVAVSQVAPLQEEGFKWPSFEEIAKTQEDFKLDRSSFEEDPETRCWKDEKGRIVIL